MLTFIFLAAGAIVVIGCIVLAMRSGTEGGRHRQAGQAEVNKQVENTPKPGSQRTSGSAND